MLKYLVVVSGILAFLGCSTSPTDSKKDHSTINDADTTRITLSHVKAYLLIGNVKQAQKTFDTISNSQTMPNTFLTLAELRAASGNAEAAQQAFLLALANDKLDKQPTSVTLIDYFCNQKKWPALQGYASSLVAIASDNNVQNASPSGIRFKNSALTQIGLCFFYEQRFDEAQNWLQQLDVTQQLGPQAYLALARMAVEQKQYSAAQALINQYEVTKTKIDAKMLWTAFEVYQALNQPDIATPLGENLRTLFPGNEYTRKYILTKKRGERLERKQQEAMVVFPTIKSLPEEKQLSPTHEQSIHIMKKGETLYQLSKRYGVTTPELMSWNPNLVLDDISIGTNIRITPIR
ncbi:LysM peptidoglycan-binding domain-containing protein [uncultured Paraglaciecola sp.]|uniref:LysM peptidoglycan-binding domain-containing protein n=1 Tax=uncultured Paraglaciecola sp. TaxID=1765024 RepID=UPI0025EA8595|nr:LysM peptidoglycan-binding domain-containing protein [uncultured Paraglaciecola sp.]